MAWMRNVVAVDARSVSLRGACLALATLTLLACRSTPPVPVAVAGTGSGAKLLLDEVPACAVDAKVSEGWNQRARPQRIFANTWYVGTCGLTALLVTSDQGHILIDGAGEPAGPLIAANIRALGFDPKDVKYLLNSHEHDDHAAGLAYLQRVSGAPVLARAPAIATLRSGRSDRSDPQQLNQREPFPPVGDVRVIADGAIVRVGALALTGHGTPGHTPGGTSWSWRSCDGERCLDIAYTDSVSAMSDRHYRYLDHPEMVQAFRSGLDTLAALPCDIQITPHPALSDLFARMQGVDGKPLVDAGACQRYAASGRAGLQQRLAGEAGEAQR